MTLSLLACPAARPRRPPAVRLLFSLLSLWLFLGPWGGQPAQAQDTTSTQGVEFTPVEAAPAARPTPAADTLFFMDAPAPAAASPAPPAAAKSAPAQVAPARAAPVSLWVTLLTGLLGALRRC